MRLTQDSSPAILAQVSDLEEEVAVLDVQATGTKQKRLLLYIYSKASGVLQRSRPSPKLSLISDLKMITD
eukprot:4921089-Amphidinium_carterae.1